MEEPNRNLQELEMQFNYLSQQVEEAKAQLNEMRMALQEMQETLFAIVELEAKPKSTLVLLGASSFVPSKIETEKVLVPIGANVLAMKTPLDARKVIEERAAKLLSAITNVEKALGQMLQMRQSLMQQAQQAQQSSM